MVKRTCTRAPCDRPHLARGLCSTHYAAARRAGMPKLAPLSLEDRFRALLQEDSSGCWLWQGFRLPTDYGTFTANGRTQIAHRLAYELFVGPIPDGLHLDHLCRVRRCVNPAHLEPVTVQENVLRSESPAALHAKQTHCVHGHPFDVENTYRPPSSSMRQCRTCNRDRDRLRARRRPL